MTNTPGMIILRTEKVLPGNGQLPYPRQSEKIGRLSRENCGGQSFLFCLLSMYCNKPSPSQALPRQLSQGESQAVRFITEVLGAMRKFPAVLLPLPLGEVALRSDDGEGEPAKVKNTTSKRLLHRGLCSSLLLLYVILRFVNAFSRFPQRPGGHRCPAGLALP